eukprot:jgi/Ulvmu1/6884/UM031_0090.1
MAIAYSSDLAITVAHGRARLSCRRRKASGVANANRAPAVILANDGQTSFDQVREAATLVADVMQDATVVSLTCAPTESTFGQLGLSTGSIIDAVRVEIDHNEYIEYELTGTTADAIYIATDPKQGLCLSLGLDPVLCVVLGKGSAVGPDSDRSAAVALTRQAAAIGIPAVSCCLASLREAAPWEPMLDTLWELLPAVKLALQSGGGYPTAVNFPRAHFPFPERGRCALGVEVPLHPSVSGAARSSGGGGSWALKDCWSLGEEVPRGQHSTVLTQPQDAQALLRAAFADADTFLNVSAPPRLPVNTQQPLFAATRCGVIWHRDEVARAGAGAPVGSREDLARSGATSRDLWGRSLPSHGLSGATSATLAAGDFVSQEQTSAVVQRRTNGGTGDRRAVAPAAAGVMRFEVGRGRTLSDPVLGGDVDALFEGRVAVTTAQTWPGGHPCSMTDAVLAAAIAEDEQSGLPAWLFP